MWGTPSSWTSEFRGRVSRLIGQIPGRFQLMIPTYPRRKPSINQDDKEGWSLLEEGELSGNDIASVANIPESLMTVQADEVSLPWWFFQVFTEGVQNTQGVYSTVNPNSHWKICTSISASPKFFFTSRAWWGNQMKWQLLEGSERWCLGRGRWKPWSHRAIFSAMEGHSNSKF